MGVAMSHVVVFDCEFLTADGAPQRFWCGPSDPDPTVVQIGAARMDLAAPYQVTERFSVLVRPHDRHGAAVVPDPVFVALTGLAADRIAAEGCDLARAMAAFEAFCGTAMVWSWGKDELNLMAISTYVAGIPANMPARRFGNACRLLVQAGVPLAEVQALRSHTLCAHFGLPAPPGKPHDALHDALSVARVLAYLLSADRLAPADLRAPGP